MIITEDINQFFSSKKIMISIDESELSKHIESRPEMVCRKLYEKTGKISDMLMYLSEFAKTEEEKSEVIAMKKGGKGGRKGC